MVPVVESSALFFKKASSILSVSPVNVQFVPALKAVLDIEIAASLLISALIMTPEEIENTPAFVTEISPLGTIGLKFVPSAINIAVSVFVASVKSSPKIVKSPPIVTLPDPSIFKSLVSSNDVWE